MESNTRATRISLSGTESEHPRRSAAPQSKSRQLQWFLDAAYCGEPRKLLDDLVGSPNHARPSLFGDRNHTLTDLVAALGGISVPKQAAAKHDAVFRLKGDFYEISWMGKTTHLKATKGLRYYELVLRSAHQPQGRLALDLVHEVSPPPAKKTSAAADAAEDGLSPQTRTRMPSKDWNSQEGARAKYERYEREGFTKELAEARSAPDPVAAIARVVEKYRMVRAAAANLRDTLPPDQLSLDSNSVGHALAAARKKLSKEGLRDLAEYLEASVISENNWVKYVPRGPMPEWEF